MNLSILTLLVVSSAAAQQVTTEELPGIRNLRRLETTVACSGIHPLWWRQSRGDNVADQAAGR